MWNAMAGRMVSIYVLVAAAAFSQDAGSVRAAIQQKIGEIKNSIAENQAQLKQYAWTETIEISLNGEVKTRNQNACRYGPDGKVQKTPIGAPAPPPSGGPLKRRIIAKKKDELTDYMDRVRSLLSRYVPPAPGSMQAAFEAGKATLEPASGTVVFNDYIKPGDKVTLTFDTATKKLVTFGVATYLDTPKDAVTINARFSSLPDGTNFMEQSVLDASAKKVQVNTTNFGYQRVGG
jgi:hypothetical protein